MKFFAVGPKSWKFLEKVSKFRIRTRASYTRHTRAQKTRVIHAHRTPASYTRTEHTRHTRAPNTSEHAYIKIIILVITAYVLIFLKIFDLHKKGCAAIQSKRKHAVYNKLWGNAGYDHFSEAWALSIIVSMPTYISYL